MKKIQLLLICLPILFSCGCNKKKNHLELEGLKGKVKEVTITISNVKEYFGDIETTDIKEKIKLRYNEDGYTTEKFVIYKNREVNYEFIYDEDGRWIEMYQSDGENEFILKYKHDDDGNHIEVDMYEINSVIDYNERFYSKVKSKFDEDGNRIEINYYNEDGELTQTDNYQYDEDGNEIEKTVSFKWSSEILMTEYRYDEDGNLYAEEKYKNGEWDEAFGYESYEFDKENNWLKYITYNASATPVSITEREIVYY
jgi:hypothetical protein